MKRFRLPHIITSFCLIVVLLSAFGVNSYAETISQKEARRIARLFFNDAYGKVCDDPQYVYNGKRLTTDRLFTPFYVFNSPEGGFVIISAENKAFPILGYSLSAPAFPKDGLTKEQTELLRNFSRDIELIRYDSRPAEEAIAAWTNIPQTIHDLLYTPTLLAENYYRYRPNEESLWILRSRSVEFPYEWPKTDEELRLEAAAEETPEYEPFSFYYDFINEIEAERTAAERRLEEMLKPSRPVVRNLGAGHFSIESPSAIDVVDFYNAEGAPMMRRYFPSKRSVSIDITTLPKGFYIVALRSNSGESFGIKLHR